MRHPDAGGQDWADLRRRLQGCALALTGSPEAADELAQQTLATLLARRPEKASHLGYARRTLVRLWLDQQRSSRRQVIRAARLAVSRARWHLDGDPESDREQVRRIQEAAATLPPRQRAVLVLRVVEGLEYDRIADLLECSVDSARSSLHLARARLRQALGDAP
ncbi:MAG: RNA polymerase sigma factor [Planctomycetota bacterium]